MLFASTISPPEAEKGELWTENERSLYIVIV